jgi:HEXXH motif-containing protein
MYFTFGAAPILQTAMTLARSEDEASPSGDPDQIRRSFHQYLTNRSSALRGAYEGGIHTPEVLRNPVLADALLDEFEVHSPLDDVDYQIRQDESSDVSDAVVTAYADRVQSALGNALEKDPTLGFVVRLALPIAFVRNSGQLVGGTVSNVPGAVWFNVRSSWTDQDIVEFVIHEFTHTLLFLEERRYGFYQNIENLMQKENFALSSIRRDMRPLDKVLHSAMVAVEICGLRDRFGYGEGSSQVHPSTAELREGVAETINSCVNVDVNSLLMPRAVEILDGLQGAQAKPAEIA